MEKKEPNWDHVEILRNCMNEQPISNLMQFTRHTNRSKFRDQVLQPLLDGGWIEMTIPDKPTSSRQRYKLTATGQNLINEK